MKIASFFSGAGGLDRGFENAGFEVNRGSSANVSLLWNETNDNWTATNDGSYFYVLADAAVDATQNASITSVTNTATAAFLAANSAATLSAATDATQNTNITNAQNNLVYFADVRYRADAIQYNMELKI